MATAAAGLFAYNAARILNERPQAVVRNFDEGALWLGLALLSLLIVAWPDSTPRVSLRAMWGALVSFWRAHWWELALFTLLFGFGVFMRVYEFGGSLPPANGLCCEEHINGGVAYRALQGERPLLYPLVRWGSAAGFLIFGETTLGLRFFFVVMGIATLVPFYLLLRQLVRPAVALFVLALYAAAWWPSLSSRQTSEGTIYAVLFAFLLVWGLKRKQPLAFFGLGVLAALLSYEYDAFRPIPYVALGFVAAAAAWTLFVPLPDRLRDILVRARSIARVAWRPALVFFLAAGIVLVPMIVGTHQGYDLYLTSVHRQQSDRGGSLFVEDWPRQASWALQIFFPFGSKQYRSEPPLDLAGISLLDPLTSTLALVGVVAGAFFFWRSYRSFFLAWFGLNMLTGALLLQNFSPWKFISLVPVVLVLAAFFLDDVWTLATRLWQRRGAIALAALFIVGMAFSFWWNADTLFNRVATEDKVRIAYASERGRMYSFCRYLRDRGDDNFSYAFKTAIPVLGFARPRDTFEQQRGAWGDFIWVCHDLQGEALPAPEEAWPLRDPPPGRTTLVFAGSLRPIEEVLRDLRLAYPDLGEPDRQILGPDESWTIWAYEFEDGRDLARTGLWSTYRSLDDAGQEATQIDPVQNLSWKRVPPPVSSPFTAEWRGVIYVDAPQRLSLQAETTAPVRIVLNGTTVYDTTADPPHIEFMNLWPGWYPVEVSVNRATAEDHLRLVWARPDGTQRSVRPADLFPLREIVGWHHERVILVPGADEVIWHRLDFSPHYSSTPVVNFLAGSGHAPGALQEERWRGLWEVERTDSYRLRVKARSGEVTVFVDGEEVTSGSTGTLGQVDIVADLQLDRGVHQVEIVQRLEAGAIWSGVTVTVQPVPEPGQEPQRAPTPVDLPMRVRPY